MIVDALTKFPFNLDPAQLGWVRGCFAALSEDDKLRQLFNLRSAGTNPDELEAIGPSARVASPCTSAPTWTRSAR